MKVSVIIPVFNGEADLPDLLGTLQAQTYSADLVEYLFVDNNSHDRTGSCLEAAVADFQHLGLTLKVYREARIQSSYAARNHHRPRVGMHADSCVTSHLHRAGRTNQQGHPIAVTCRNRRS